MNPILRNILAVIVGVVVCLLLNGMIISLGSSIIPPPAGADMTTVEGMKAAMHLLEPKHFIMPFLAHALPSFVGALLAAFIAASRKMIFALVVGVVHFLGGIAAAFIIPAPVWFIALDLIVAYVPMAWLGGKLAARGSV